MLDYMNISSLVPLAAEGGNAIMLAGFLLDGWTKCKPALVRKDLKRNG